jgi:hypothetical protein
MPGNGNPLDRDTKLIYSCIKYKKLDRDVGLCFLLCGVIHAAGKKRDQAEKSHNRLIEYLSRRQVGDREQGGLSYDKAAQFCIP